ncbi:MAG: zf-HC2 domain-containing protein [Tumebacillaceae bacterium]
MTHDFYRELLQRELDDDLSTDERAMLEAHVSTCAECRLEREQYQNLSFGLSKLSQVVPEKSFVPQLELEVQRALQAQRRTRRAPAWWRGATAAAVVVLAAGIAGVWQFAGQNGSDGQVALDSSSTHLQADTNDAKQPPTADATTSQQDAGQNPVQPSAPDPKKQQTAPLASARTEPGSTQDTSLTGVPQKKTPSSDGTTAQKSPNVAQKPESQPASPAASSSANENSSEQPAGQIGGLIGSTGIAGTDATTPTDSMGIAGSSVGISGDSPGEPTPQIGQVPPSPSINPRMQQAVHDGDRTAQWATDSALVVEHMREQLGFRADATVSKTDRADRVHIAQDGMEFEVRLQQPFEKGEQGIWTPVQVGRLINQSAPDSLQRPIVDYFHSHHMAAHGELLIIGDYDERARTMLVAADVAYNGVEKESQYLCKLQLDAEGMHWELAGLPIEQ